MLACCPGWVCGQYWLPPQFWGEDVSTSTATYNWTSLWQQMLRLISSDLAIHSVCDKTGFVYLQAEDNQTVRDLRDRLQRNQSYEASGLLSIFPLPGNLWELLVHRSHVSSLKKRAESVGYIVEEGFHPTESSHRHHEPHDPLVRRLLAIERLVARAVVIHLLSETPQDTDTLAASVYLELVRLYQCNHLFWPIRSALNGLAGFGTLTELSCMIADNIYRV